MKSTQLQVNKDAGIQQIWQHVLDADGVDHRLIIKETRETTPVPSLMKNS